MENSYFFTKRNLVETSGALKANKYKNAIYCYIGFWARNRDGWTGWMIPLNLLWLQDQLTTTNKWTNNTQNWKTPGLEAPNEIRPCQPQPLWELSEEEEFSPLLYSIYSIKAFFGDLDTEKSEGCEDCLRKGILTSCQFSNTQCKPIFKPTLEIESCIVFKHTMKASL